MKHTFFNKEQIQSLQEQYEKTLDKVSDVFEECEMKSYRCVVCLGHCNKRDYFHPECAQQLIEGHSLECLRSRQERPDSTCRCPAPISQ